MTLQINRRAVLAGLGVCTLPRMARSQSDPIADLVAQVDRMRVRQTVFDLSSFPTRWTPHPDFGAVEAWVAEAFGAHGPVQRQAFAMPSGKIRHNIIAGDLDDPRPRVIVGAHFDAISETPETDAPGANDNATGIAAMLEAWRILADLMPERQVSCMAFAGEEQGFLGSTHAASVVADEGWSVPLMLNLDMLGHRPRDPSAPMVIEYDMGKVDAAHAAAAQTHGERARDLAAAHTTLNTMLTDIWGSDYMPFEARGVPCSGLFDGGVEGALYHTTQDRPDRVDYGRLHQATRLAVAILADAAGISA